LDKITRPVKKLVQVKFTGNSYSYSLCVNVNHYFKYMQTLCGYPYSYQCECTLETGSRLYQRLCLQRVAAVSVSSMVRLVGGIFLTTLKKVLTKLF